MNIFTSKSIQNYAKWASKPEVTEKINKTLPIIQSTYAVACYGLNVQRTKDIPQDKKNSMLIHDIICGATGLGVSAWLTKKTIQFKMNVIKEINKDSKLKNKVAICNGVSIGVPIVVTTLIMRAFIPVLASFISPKIEKFRQRRKQKKTRAEFQKLISSKQKYQ